MANAASPAKGWVEMRGIVFALIAALPLTALAAPQCLKGKPCGQSCIAADQVCHKPLCKVGKPCGDACIAKDKVCRVP